MTTGRINQVTREVATLESAGRQLCVDLPSLDVRTHSSLLNRSSLGQRPTDNQRLCPSVEVSTRRARDQHHTENEVCLETTQVGPKRKSRTRFSAPLPDPRCLGGELVYRRRSTPWRVRSTLHTPRLPGEKNLKNFDSIWDLVKNFQTPPLLSHRSRPPKIHTDDKKATQYSILLYALNPVFFKNPILRLPGRARETRTCVNHTYGPMDGTRRVADDTRLAFHEGSPDLALSRFFTHFSTLSQSSQTWGACMPRCQKHYERQ